MVEGYASDDGFRWMAEQARELTGRAPSHLVLTHYHGDHTGGLRAAGASGDLRILATGPTRDRVRERNADPPEEVLAGVGRLDTRRPTEIDLGDRTVLVVPRRGHTASDVTVEVVDPPVVFCGDLVWNRMFPNYMDARPSRLGRSVGLLRAREARIWVPGHGPLAGPRELDRYLELLEHVESAARSAVEAGWSAAEAARRFSLPPILAEWTLFSPRYPEVALEAWMDELSEGD
jgi:glyoxylase-like metal-dependent hydrolase (beta-lactamase superfamily II)